jgi:hypothetical protein
MSLVDLVDACSLVSSVPEHVFDNEHDRSNFTLNRIVMLGRSFHARFLIKSEKPSKPDLLDQCNRILQMK